MKSVTAQRVEIEPAFDAWRDRARQLLLAGTPPGEVSIRDAAAQETGLLFAASPESTKERTAPKSITVSAAFVERAKVVACHRSPERWDLLYRVLWRLQQDRNLLRVEVDEDVAEINRLHHQVKRDLHKMHAFLRFRRIEDEDGEHYIAWYEPDHRILPLATPFFVDRFAVMRWSILTPDGSIQWDPQTKKLTHGTGLPRSAAPTEDQFDDLWRTYYKSIFNPARINLPAMRSEMPVRYWKNLPEIDSLPQMIRESDRRVEKMIGANQRPTAEAFLPQSRSLPVLDQAIRACQGCDLFQCATQAVFGRGPADAQLMLVGEQPGEEEDRAGRPFVGPAGRLLDRLLDEAGIDRSQTYVTNAVKHFKFTERGKRRLHETPRMQEIVACRPWLLAEMEAVQLSLVLCLGASAAKSLLGSSFALMRQRGAMLSSPYAPRVMATIHPSAILRATDPERAGEMQRMLVADLQAAASVVNSGPAADRSPSAHS